MKIPAIFRSIELIYYIKHLEKRTETLVLNIQKLPQLNKYAITSFLTGSDHQLQILDWQYKDFLKDTDDSLAELESCFLANINFLDSTTHRAKTAINNANNAIQLLYTLKNNKLRQVKIAERIKKTENENLFNRFLLEEGFI